MIRLTIPSIDDAECQAATDVLQSGYLVQGPCVAEFEARLAERVGTRHAVAVSSGTAALHIALLALDIGPGHRVATTAYSWPATANVIELCGATPVFVDLDPTTGNMSPDALSESLAQLERDGTHESLAAILPVHLFGHMADMPAILDIATRHGVPVVEDAACALGSCLASQPAGSWGRIGCFSFHPRKAITTGEGGVVTTDDDQLALTLKALRNHGLDAGSTSPDFIRPGFNYRLTDLQAAVGLAQLEKLDPVIEARRRAAAVYSRLLADLPVTTPVVPARSAPNWQSYVIRLPAGTDRSRLVQALRDRDIESTMGTWHIPRTTWFANRYGWNRGDFPVADLLFDTELTIPLYEGITEKDQRSVADAIRDSLPVLSA